MKIKETNLDNLKKFFKEESFLIVDSNVWDLYKEKFVDCKVYIATAGEQSKQFSEYQKCINFLIENGATRKTHLVAIGGGAVCDMAGFVAATLFRGVSWSVVPTTLLSMVDSCLGGKVAINTDHGKNLVGAFYNPEQIIISFEFLETLPRREFESGLGEIIKYSFLNKGIYRLIENNADIQRITWACLKYKKKIVAKDFNESGIRKFLNLGHTIGHVLERKESLPHGIAVIWGIYYLLQYFNRPDLLKEFHGLMKKLNLDHLEKPILTDLSMIAHDKKNVGSGMINLVSVKKIGSPFYKEVSIERLVAALKRYD